MLKPAIKGIVWVAALSLMFNARPVVAQEGTGTLRGTVTDVTGAIVRGAQVSISNQATGLNRRTVMTSEAGIYVFPSLVPGKYRVTVEARGFKTIVREDIGLGVGETQELKVILEVGTTEETITITGEAPIIETTSKEIGGHINQRELVELPSVNRNFIGFVGLLPGVVANVSTESFGSDSVSVNGQDPRYNNFLLDGANNNDDVIGQRAGAQARTALEAVAEFQVVTNQYDAEFGRTSGGIINAITKSGTNQFHGSGFGFFQDAALNSTDRFAELNQLEEPESNMKQWGGTIGGPIKKDRAHFFFSYERTTIADGVVVNIPARPELNASTTEDTKATNTLLRFDTQPSDNSQVAFRWLRESSPQFNQIINAFGRPVTLGASREESDVDQTFVGSWTSILTPRFLNDMRVSFTRENVAFANPEFNSGKSMSELLPTLVFASFVDQQSDVAQARINNSYRLADTISWSRQNHSLKFGLDYNYVTADNNNEGDLNGVFFFPTDLAFDAANPRTYPERLQLRVGGPQQFVMVDHNIGLFVQDSWRVNGKLTLNLGARYDKETITPDNNNFAPRVGLAYDPTESGKMVIRAGYGWFYSNTPFEVITAFRTAGPFATSFVRLFPLNTADPGPRAGLFPTDPTLKNGPTVDPGVINSIVGTGALLGNPSPFVDNLDRVMPSVRTASVGFQRELLPTLSLTVDYIHQDGVDQFVTAGLNAGTRSGTGSGDALTRRYATLGEVVQNSFIPVDTSLFANLPFETARAANVRTRANKGSTDYDALQVSLDKRFSRGLQFKVSYTLSDSRGDVSGSALANANFQILDDLGLAQSHGPTDFDRPHNFVFSGLYEVPRTHGLIVSSIIRAMSGTPFTIFDSRTDPNRNGINFDPLAAGTFTGSRVFPNSETLAFSFENDVGVNGARAPGFFSVDLRLAYKYNFTERIRAGFTFELFNVTNKVNYTPADLGGDFNGGNNANFLVPTSAFPPRTIQLGFRVSF
jgi:outer membrane receptor protein involved in Fe transport